ncbi:MAG: heavy metal-binding domain-containing protein, partial [Steroidobacteraceae bacterium]
MHPEVRRTEPGGCPICGMALEPLQPAAQSEGNPELREMVRRFWIGAALAIPLVALAMAGDVGASNAHRYLRPVVSVWLELALSTPVVLWAGGPLLVRGWASVRLRSLNMFSLIALGVCTSYLYSVAAVLAPGAFPRSLRGAGGVIPVYF